jgi:hypothetical protein
MKTRNIIMFFEGFHRFCRFDASIFASEEALDQESSIWHRS